MNTVLEETHVLNYIIKRCTLKTSFAISMTLISFAAVMSSKHCLNQTSLAIHFCIPRMAANYDSFKAERHLNFVFSPLNMALRERSRSRFKQYKNSMLTPLFYVSGCFEKFLGDFWVYLEEIVFLKELVKLGKIK